ncbi:uncharacterized protein [Dysidea avara]|uniref:uncharacterized protein isoform X1 n=1 Tax=Dysidea avara TaxID=196820 RepID=UPI00332814BB
MEKTYLQQDKHGESTISSRETSILSCDSSPGSPTSSVASQHSKSSMQPAAVKGSNSLPDPFPIPVFRQTTEQNLVKKDLYPDDRRYMVRVLSTMILAHVSKASVHDCEQVGKALVQKFPFLKEYHSWAQFMYVGCQNCNRKPANATSEPKPKKKMSDNHHYSTIFGEPEDAETHARNMELLETEWTKFIDKKASADGVKELMSRTFLHRRECICHSERPVSEIMKEYRCLSRLIFVAYVRDGQSEDMMEQFEEKWKRFVRVIMSYSRAIPFQTKELKQILEELGDDCDVPQIISLKLNI